MANTKTITSANAVFLLTINDLFTQPVQLQGFATDTAFTTDAIATSEAVMGVDGKLSAGVVLNPIKQKISIMPDSDSIAVFDVWNQQQRINRTVYFANATIDLPALGKSFTMTRGTLTSAHQISDAKKVLQAQEYEITWEGCSGSEI